jgi:hypothetical protein
MLQAVWFDRGPRAPGRLLLVVHCLAINGVSWRILLPDLAAALAAAAAGRDVRLDPVPVSFRAWAQRLARHPGEHAAELPYWQQVLATADSPLGDRPLDPGRDTAETAWRATLTLPTEYATPLLSGLPAAGAGVTEVLLAALAMAVTQWRRRRGQDAGSAVLIGVRGHGREQVAGAADLSRTVGWFTSIYPLAVDPGAVSWPEVRDGGPGAGQAIRRAAEQWRAVPGPRHRLRDAPLPEPRGRAGPGRSAGTAGRVHLPGPVQRR